MLQAAIIMLRQFVNTRFQVLFHSPPGVLFTFPSQYCFSIGHWVVFSLGRWSSRLPAGFHVSRSTPDTAGISIIVVRGFHSLWLAFPKPFLQLCVFVMRSIPRSARTPVWAHSISLAATLEIEFFFLFLRVLRCFSSPGSRHTPMYSVHDN